MKSVKVSVVIPLYNKEHHIIDAIKSVLNQQYSVDEIIVVDDGSTDDGARVVKDANLQNVTLLEQANQGVSVARNNGVALARNEMIAFLDADDIWLPMFIDEMVHLYHQFPACGIYASRYQNQSQQGEFSDPNINLSLLAKNKLDPNGMLVTNYFEICGQGDLPFMVSSLMIDKAYFELLGGFPEGEKLGEDQELFANAALSGPIAYSPNINMLYSTEAENKATAIHVPREECAFSKRLDEKIENQPSEELARHIRKYCAAHLCYIAKLNIKTNQFTQAKKLITDQRCRTKPVHQLAIYTLAVVGEFFQGIKSKTQVSNFK